MNANIQPQTTNLKPQRRGFTLTEILVVIGIIVILISILVPVVGRVRKASQVASVQAQLNSIAGAVDRYHQDHKAYPGPVPNDDLRRNGFMGVAAVSPTPAGYLALPGPGTDNGGVYYITAAENLVLGLLGGLVPQPGVTPLEVAYDPTSVGKGAMNLNVAKPTRSAPYLEAVNLSWRNDDAGLKTGRYKDAGAEALDSIIPEFVDVFPSPLPIIYLRARTGTQGRSQPPPYQPDDNPVITDVPSPTATVLRGHYDWSQFSGYVERPIGEGKSLPTQGLTAPITTTVITPKNVDNNGVPIAPYTYPYNSYPYFKAPSSPQDNAVPRNKDGYILISAGLDRVYGTEDDITSFGAVHP